MRRDEAAVSLAQDGQARWSRLSRPPGNSVVEPPERCTPARALTALVDLGFPS
jgi:hypothetical protein